MKKLVMAGLIGTVMMAGIFFPLSANAGSLTVKKVYIRYGSTSGGKLVLDSGDIFKWTDKARCKITPSFKTMKGPVDKSILVKPSELGKWTIKGKIKNSEGVFPVSDSFWHYKLISATFAAVTNRAGKVLHPLTFLITVTYRPRNLPVGVVMGKPKAVYKHKSGEKWLALGSLSVKNKEIPCADGGGSEEFEVKWTLKKESAIKKERIGPGWNIVTIGGVVEFPEQDDELPIN